MNLRTFVIFLSLLLPHLPAHAHRPDGVTVVQVDARARRAREAAFASDVHELREAFLQRGSSAAAITFAEQLKDQKALERWRELADSTYTRLESVAVHPSQAEAVQWINHRFARMGIPNFKFDPTFDGTLHDPARVVEEEINTMKWLRYGSGPGIAVLSTLAGLPPPTTGTVSEYLVLIVPAISVGVTTVVLELFFANPRINREWLKPLWNLGGPLGGRAVNLTINYGFGMALWGANVGAAALPRLWGGGMIPTSAPDLATASVAALVGAITMHLAMGQYATDVALEHKRGSITESQRYELESAGSVVANGGRVATWVLPPDQAIYGYAAEGAFFLLKTLPQTIKTYLGDPLHDARALRVLRPDAPPMSRTLRCADALSGFPLINLPKLELRRTYRPPRPLLLPAPAH